jgi:hypothetical protein
MNASVAPSINIVDPDLELAAEQLENDLLDCRAKLAELLPAIQTVRTYFAANRGRAMLRGCKTWREFCVRRLRVTPQAVFVCVKRLNLSTAQKELAAEKAKEASRLRRWEADAEQSHARRTEEWKRGREFAGARNKLLDEQMPDVTGYEPATESEDDDVARVIPMDALDRTLASLDQATETLNRIIASGSLAPALLAEAKKCVTHIASVAACTRSEFDIRDPNCKAKVVSIEGREQ